DRHVTFFHESQHRSADRVRSGQRTGRTSPNFSYSPRPTSVLVLFRGPCCVNTDPCYLILSSRMSYERRDHTRCVNYALVMYRNRTHNRVVICRVVSGTPQVNNNAPKLDRAIDPTTRRGRAVYSRHNSERWRCVRRRRVCRERSLSVACGGSARLCAVCDRRGSAHAIY
ncbi:hypothetical protein HW555_010969, partial [Spodoptera exigua]